MDVKALNLKQNSETGSICEIEYPLGTKTDIKISVKGNFSDSFAKARREYENANQIAELVSNSFSQDEYDAKFDSHVLAKITTGWEGITSDGKPFAFSAENAYELYLSNPVIRMQLFRHAGNIENFIVSESKK